MHARRLPSAAGGSHRQHSVLRRRGRTCQPLVVPCCMHARMLLAFAPRLEHVRTHSCAHTCVSATPATVLHLSNCHANALWPVRVHHITSHALCSWTSDGRHMMDFQALRQASTLRTHIWQLAAHAAKDTRENPYSIDQRSHPCMHACSQSGRRSRCGEGRAVSVHACMHACTSAWPGPRSTAIQHAERGAAKEAGHRPTRWQLTTPQAVHNSVAGTLCSHS